MSSAMEESVSEDTPVLSKKRVSCLNSSHGKPDRPGVTFFQRGIAEESSDDEIGSESPLDEVPASADYVGSASNNIVYPPSSLNLRDRRSSMTRSDTS